MKVHVTYLGIITCLLILVGGLAISRVFEQDAAIRSEDDSEVYTLRMLASGDLVFEKHRFLPLASYRDYWGDMNVTSVEWLAKDKVNITMSDGSRLNVSSVR